MGLEDLKPYIFPRISQTHKEGALLSGPPQLLLPIPTLVPPLASPALTAASHGGDGLVNNSEWAKLLQWAAHGRAIDILSGQVDRTRPLTCRPGWARGSSQGRIGTGHSGM